MGRRALRKPDPAIDLSRHFLELEQVPRPFDRTVAFGRAVPLEVEVGSGKGLFLGGAAGEFPDHDFLGVELADKYARAAAARLAKLGRSNAILIQGDALRFFRECLLDDSLAAVHVYFPDPWWKKRHRKRRVMNEAFVKDIERTLQPSGRLHFWSDVPEYFESTLALLAATTKLLGPFDVSPRDAAHDLDYRTHFERRMRLHDIPVYRSEFRKP